MNARCNSKRRFSQTVEYPGAGRANVGAVLTYNMPRKHQYGLYADEYDDGFGGCMDGSEDEDEPRVKPSGNSALRRSVKGVQRERTPQTVEVVPELEKEVTEDIRQMNLNSRSSGMAEASTSQHSNSGVGGPPRRPLAAYVPEAWMLGSVSEEKRTLHLIVVRVL